MGPRYEIASALFNMCATCYATHLSAADLSRHVTASNHSPRWVIILITVMQKLAFSTCSRCNKCLKLVRNDFYLHLTKCHKTIECPVCHEKCSARTYRKHTDKHTKRLPCVTMCGETFPSNSNFWKKTPSSHDCWTEELQEERGVPTEVRETGLPRHGQERIVRLPQPAAHQERTEPTEEDINMEEIPCEPTFKEEMDCLWIEVFANMRRRGSTHANLDECAEGLKRVLNRYNKQLQEKFTELLGKTISCVGKNVFVISSPSISETITQDGQTWRGKEKETVRALLKEVGLDIPKSVRSKYMRNKNVHKAKGVVPGEVVKFPVTVNEGGGPKALGGGDFGNYFYRSVTKWLKTIGSDPDVRTLWRQDRHSQSQNFMWGSVSTETVHSHPMNAARAKKLEADTNKPVIHLELYTDGVSHGKGGVRARIDSKLVHVYIAVR